MALKVSFVWRITGVGVAGAVLAACGTAPARRLDPHCHSFMKAVSATPPHNLSAALSEINNVITVMPPAKDRSLGRRILGFSRNLAMIGDTDMRAGVLSPRELALYRRSVMSLRTYCAG